MPCSDHAVTLDWCRNCAESDEAAEKHATYVKRLREAAALLRSTLHDAAGCLPTGTKIAARAGDVLDATAWIDEVGQ